MADKITLLEDTPEANERRQRHFDYERFKLKQQQQQLRRDTQDADTPRVSVWTEHVMESLKKVPNSRAYVLDADAPATRAIGSTLAAWQRRRAGQGKGFTREDAAKFLEKRLAPHIPGLVQDWRPPEENNLPEIPVDPITKQPMKNPWEKPYDLTSQSLLAQEDPVLAEHLKEVAKTGGSSYSRIKRLRDEAQARKQLRDLEYDAEEHGKNVFARPDANVTQRSEFAAKHPPAVLDVYKREAAQGVEIPWHPGANGSQNLTRMMALRRADPKLREIVDEAAAIERGWAADELETAQGVERIATQKRLDAQRILQSAKK